MTVKDIVNGPEWAVWVVFVVLAVISIVLLSGHGENLIAGYNTATEEEKTRYDTKRLCRVVGGGFTVIAITALIIGIWGDVLPASFSYVLLGVILAAVAAIGVLAHTVCKKNDE
ncbi:MAG: DUF3784 domain-containing protein [Firmicutes bacterium]|nr:DUF3784 domain-containing protein [Lachnospiraceae bacterium]MBQ7057686.1 DUF3784 domain-containing protein [Bacillota bacterium]